MPFFGRIATIVALILFAVPVTFASVVASNDSVTISPSLHVGLLPTETPFPSSTPTGAPPTETPFPSSTPTGTEVSTATPTQESTATATPNAPTFTPTATPPIDPPTAIEIGSLTTNTPSTLVPLVLATGMLAVAGFVLLRRR